MSRDKHYKIFAQRLSDKNILWLKKNKDNYPSWNKFFDKLKEVYERQPRKHERPKS